MKLILFTNNFPYGIREKWKIDEIDLLSLHFDLIDIVPFKGHEIINLNITQYKNINFYQPLSSLPIKLNYRTLLFSLFSRNIFYYILELIRLIKIRPSKNNLIKFLNSIEKSRIILNSEYFKKLLCLNNSDTILYFYWGVGASEVIPFLNVKDFKKVVVRLHRYDLYEYENENYIPFRKHLLNTKIDILPCSDDGLKYLKSKYPNHKANIVTQRIGVKNPYKKLDFSNKKTLRIVSCSLLVPVKRIDKMIRAASLLSIPFEWKHIGFGELHDVLEKQIIELDLSNKFQLVGKIDSDLIFEYYLENNFDIFVNTSKSEGIPISIMEAFAIGIPVIATDVGGTSEILDSRCGTLLNKSFEDFELTKAIEEYYFLSNSEKIQKKNSSYSTYINKCDIEPLTKELINILKS